MRPRNMRRFVLNRNVDVSGMSGTGVVAQGCEFADGSVAVFWLSEMHAWNLYGSMKAVEILHGHGGATTIEWIDE